HRLPEGIVSLTALENLLARSLLFIVPLGLSDLESTFWLSFRRSSFGATNSYSIHCQRPNFWSSLRIRNGTGYCLRHFWSRPTPAQHTVSKYLLDRCGCALMSIMHSSDCGPFSCTFSYPQMPSLVSQLPLQTISYNLTMACRLVPLKAHQANFVCRS